MNLFFTSIGLGSWVLRRLFLYLLEDERLILVDPAFVLDFAFDHFVAFNAPHDCADTAHVEKDTCAYEVLTECANFVLHCNHQICLSCYLIFIFRDSKLVTLHQVNLLIILSLAQEQFRLLPKFNLDHNSFRVQFSGLTGPLDEVTAGLRPIVFKDADAIHTILDHHIDELLRGALV